MLGALARFPALQGAQRDEVTGGELGLRHAGKFADCLYACVRCVPELFKFRDTHHGVGVVLTPEGREGGVGYECVTVGGSNRFAPKGVELVVGHVVLPP